MFTQLNSAEPESKFYLALTRNGKVEFLLGDLHDELTRTVVDAIEKCDGNKQLAAKVLGVSRGSLYTYLEELEIRQYAE